MNDCSNNKNIRYNEIIKMIERQTNYDKKTISEKLKKWDNNYLYVIKEYMNPCFLEKKSKPLEKSLNQQIMTEIRNFCNNKIH